jgi:hypothetical protein
MSNRRQPGWIGAENDRLTHSRALSSSDMRTPFVVGNWKLHKTIGEALALVTELKNQLAAVKGVAVAVAPPFPSLSSVAKRLEDSSIGVAAQNCHWEPKGAFTGEVSPLLLADAGCTWCIVGHSERRTLFGEDSATVGKKAKAVLAAGLGAIVCVGETEPERDANRTFDVLDEQLAGGLPPPGPLDAAMWPHRAHRLERPGAGGARAHPPPPRRALRQRHRCGAAHPVRWLGQAEQRREPDGRARYRRCAGGRRLAGGGRFRGDRQGREAQVARPSNRRSRASSLRKPSSSPLAEVGFELAPRR